MNTVPAISIIVPVYNTEKFIRRCLDSILAQTFPNFEVLLVDDGSPDRAGTICEEYAETDRRFSVYHKPNGGVASARQYGIDRARGVYTIQIDSDDWVAPAMLEELYDRAVGDNADIVICDYYVNYNRYQRYHAARPADFTSHGVLKSLIYGSQGYLWNKLIRTSCYHDPETVNLVIGQNLFEDMIVCCKILKYPRRISYLSKAFYHYRQVPNSYLHATSLYSQYIKLNSILEGMLDVDIYGCELLYLKKIEAYHALQERALSKSEYIARYGFLRVTSYQWFGEKAVMRALNGFYDSAICLIRIKIWCKSIIKRVVL